MNDTAPSTAEHIPGTILITGATGFVGAGILRGLGRTSDHSPVGPFATSTIRTLARKPGTSLVGVEPVIGDVTDAATLRGKLNGVQTVVHLVGIIEESGIGTFDSVIRQGTENIIRESTRAGVTHVVLMSALGAQDNSDYPYHQAKYRAEQAVKASGLPYTIIRPSVIFGKGDGFITVLAGLVKSFPVVPVVGSGSSKFQPVQLDDVAASFAEVISNPAASLGQTYELGGARPYTYEQMLDLIAAELGRKKPKVHVPVPLMKAVMTISRPLPKSLRPPVTIEQLKMLTLDNSTANSATELLIGHKPVALEDGIAYIRDS